MDAQARCWAELDAAALRHNLHALRARLPGGCQVMAVVKAGAYGHGADAVAQLCAGEGVTAFAVATVSEGAALRRGGIRGDILVLGRAFPGEYPDAFQSGLTLTAAGREHARELAACGLPLRVHVAVNTGMNRLGFDWRDLSGITGAYRALRVEGLYTHLCDTGDPAFSRTQAERFFSLARSLPAPGLLHVQATGGIFSLPGLPCQYARPGLGLYGYGGPGLRPVLSLRCRVSAVHTLAAGETAGYDRAFTARRPTRLAALTVGYADGLPRTLSQGRGRVLLHGRSAPIAGLICMDQTLVDVTEVPEVRPGDTATLIGPGLDAQAVASAAGTIPNELLTGLGSRVVRVWRD